MQNEMKFDPLLNNNCNPLTLLNNTHKSIFDINNFNIDFNKANLTDNNNNNNNNNNSCFKPRMTGGSINNNMKNNGKCVNMDSGINVHYYFRCGAWTSSNHKDINYVKNLNTDCKSNWFFNSSLAPVMRVIEPKTVDNINILSYYDEYIASKSQRNVTGMNFNNNNKNNSYNGNNGNNGKKSYKNMKVGALKDYMFFSKHCTSQLQRMIDENWSLINPQRLYQFESRYFQFCLLQGNVTFIQTNIQNNNDNNGNNGNNGTNKMKECLIFRFGHQSKYGSKNGRSLFGVAIRNKLNYGNNKNTYQPWQCCDIVTQSNILSYFDLQNESTEAKVKFLSYLPKCLVTKQEEFDATIMFDSNLAKISKLLRKGNCKYLKDKRYATSNNFGSDDSPISDSDNSTLSINSNNSNNNNNKNNNNNNNNNRDGYYSNLPSFNHKNANAKRGRRGGRGSSMYNYTRNAHKRVKNERKFAYLAKIATEMGISFDDLVDQICVSIENAFEFARLNPTTVLTQAYIDEQTCEINYELVLLAEIEDMNNFNTYKFGIPIVLSKTQSLEQQKQGLYINKLETNCYVAKNILTPQMVIENVMLNTKNVCPNPQSWIAHMLDGRSYCQYIHSMRSTNDNNSNNNDTNNNNNNNNDLKTFVPHLPTHSNSRKSREISGK